MFATACVSYLSNQIANAANCKAICGGPSRKISQTKNAIGIKPIAFFGGGWWIRTTEVSDNRFTVCPLWPLGKSPIWSW